MPKKTKRSKYQLLQDLVELGLARHCQQCGDMLTTLRKNAKYCSDLCRSAANNARYREMLKQFKESQNAIND